MLSLETVETVETVETHKTKQCSEPSQRRPVNLGGSAITNGSMSNGFVTVRGVQSCPNSLWVHLS